jgi:monoamine oxidase
MGRVYDVIVVGGGLTGLTAATLLRQAGHSIIILEAAARVGGRILSMREPTSNQYLGDLGPTWVWPKAQPLVARWLARLNVETVRQFDDGEVIIDQAAGVQPVRYRLPGMNGSHRIAGGTESIIGRFAELLSEHFIRTRTRVKAISIGEAKVEVVTDNAEWPILRARRVVIAIPLRVAAASVTWSPPLDIRVVRAMEATPTWMAAQAKAVVVYARPFWRARGLSGRIASRVGPLMEAHDHSGLEGTPAAIFGFIGWPHQLRRTRGTELRDAILQQLVRCFGEGARNFVQFQVEDWAQNALVCAPKDLSNPPQHPGPAPAILRQAHGDGQIFFAVAELSTLSPGLIEGAFDVGSDVAKRVSATLR